MMTYLDRRGAMYRFRRVIPEELRPFFRTASGAPRAEFSESLHTKDRREAEKLCLKRAIETTAQLEEARERLARGDTAARGSGSVPMRAMSLGEIEAMEAASADNAEAHHAWEARERVRAQLISGAKDNHDAVALALRDLIGDELSEPEHSRRERQAKLKEDWDTGAAEFVLQWASERGLGTPPSYPALPALFSRYARVAGLEPATVK